MHLDPLAILTAFGLIFLAELPDKTMFASLAMGTRMRPLYVWFGTSTAFVVHVAIAVGAGSLIGLLPDWTVKSVSAALFAFGAFMLLRGTGDDEEDVGGGTVTGFWPVYTTAFMAVFISEWGDLTQITTANLAATNGVASVAVGSAAALMSVSALALLAGRFIAKRVPLKTVQRIGGLCMLGLAVWSVVEIFTG
ncbi:putative Ca2+/H+ antiporter (TMEM165/GDT1 family) [Streptomyces phaeochromogenes]|jgi:putative Ca2+/H+ antiporter (TMEM165/GDT1 family)|uniref:TMEM165/GDT1 family protein n=1 Tax=Streptomyces phaeochromogenes TaxID=1923 RepID=UPI0027923165|nr:TMEM165/GDT1 family protein [Streptomyces phaeochromogenes]MDQ0954644.1 putative Ca2+/H+ antiporter (TMEM165/GDT1 family) [Streptomyces phaeochromogenes]